MLGGPAKEIIKDWFIATSRSFQICSSAVLSSEELPDC